MTLRDRAFLELGGDNVISEDRAYFEFPNDLQIDESVTRNYLVGQFGAQITTAYEFLSAPEDFAVDDTSEDRRVGYSVDAGGGEWGGTVTFSVGAEDVRWGDGSGGTGEANITTTDASGAEVAGIVRLQVLQYWLAKMRADSTGYARLHYGEWTDGDPPGVDGAGVFGRPIFIGIPEVEVRTDLDQPGTITADLQYRRVRLADGVVGEVADRVTEFSQDIFGDIEEAVTDP